MEGYIFVLLYYCILDHKKQSIISLIYFVGNFFTSWATGSFSWRTQLHLREDDDDDTNNSIKFFIIYVLSQQL
jgi:hypothetical protein